MTFEAHDSELDRPFGYLQCILERVQLEKCRPHDTLKMPHSFAKSFGNNEISYPRRLLPRRYE